MKNIRNLFIFYLLFFLSKIFCLFPWKINIFFGWFLGRVFYYFDFRYKYLAFKNLKFIFPKYDYKKIINTARDCYSNLGKNLFEFFLFPRIKNFLNKIVKFSEQDFKILKNLLEQKKGVVIFSSHFGNWELLGATLAFKNFPLAVIARNVYIRQLNSLVEKFRSSVGEMIVGRKEEHSVKKLLLALKSGYAIGVLIDQNIKNVKNAYVKFLGKVAATPISFVEVVIKYKIPSVVALIYRLNDNTHKIVVLPIKDEFYNDKIKFIEYVNEKISEYIIFNPSQWVWMHNRWELKYEI